MREWFRKLLGPYGPETKKVQLGFFFGSWAILAAIGLFIPEKVLSENEWAWRFSDFMASIVPQIDRITALNLRPEVNKFHYSILWAVSPIFPGCLLPSIYMSAIEKAEKKGTTYGQALAGVILFSLFIAETMFVLMTSAMHDPTDRIERIAFYYPLSRAVFAPIWVSVFWMSVTGILFIVWGFLTGRFERAPRSEVHGG